VLQGAIRCHADGCLDDDAAERNYCKSRFGVKPCPAFGCGSFTVNGNPRNPALNIPQISLTYCSVLRHRSFRAAPQLIQKCQQDLDVQVAADTVNYTPFSPACSLGQPRLFNSPHFHHMFLPTPSFINQLPQMLQPHPSPAVVHMHALSIAIGGITYQFPQYGAYRL
jgi:hypothetical protein